MCLQDSLTAEDFAFSEGLPGNKNNYTLTYRCCCGYTHHPHFPSPLSSHRGDIWWSMIVISSIIIFTMINIHLVILTMTVVCSGLGTSITTGRTEFAPTHAGSLPNSELVHSHLISDPWSLPNSEQNILGSNFSDKIRNIYKRTTP